MKLKIFLISYLVAFLFFSCTKQAQNATTNVNLPAVDTVITGTVTFREPQQIKSSNNGIIEVKYIRSSPCYPSNEIYFFTANTPSIADTLNTTYTWKIRMASTYILTGKRVQFVFERAGFWKVELEVKTNGIVVDTMSIDVNPFGQKANNRNVSINADCINSNIKSFVSFYSTDNEPLDGFINARYWNFDDGSYDTVKFVQHQFPLIPYDKYYDVKLFVNNSSGCKDSALNKVFVPTTYNLPCKFTWFQTDACKPNNEVFTFGADTTGVPKGAIYLRDYKDYVKDVAGATTTHLFTHPNRYDVTLKIMYEGRELCSYYDTNVVAKGQNVTPIAYFYTSIEEIKTDSVRRFFNCQSKFDNGGFLIDILWDYGDGTSQHRPQNDYNARHTYTRKLIDMPYKIKMVITDKSGCKDSTTTNIIIPKI